MAPRRARLPSGWGHTTRLRVRLRQPLPSGTRGATHEHSFESWTWRPQLQVRLKPDTTTL